MYSNLAVYRAIAEEANASAQSLSKQAHSPMSDGSVGVVITFDPSQRSFKQSLIAIAFAAIYFEALLFAAGKKRLGAQWLQEMDRKPYEDKLRTLGVLDEPVLEEARRLRQTRNGLVHEKAAPLNELSSAEVLWAQEEAARSVQFISLISERLQE